MDVTSLFLLHLNMDFFTIIHSALSRYWMTDIIDQVIMYGADVTLGKHL